MSLFTKKTLATALVLLIAAQPASVLACATCYGASDSPLAEGMNWGIATLLGFIGSMLACVVAFFVHVARRSARLENAAQSQIQTDPQS